MDGLPNWLDIAKEKDGGFTVNIRKPSHRLNRQ